MASYLRQQANQQTAAVFYNSSSSYSQSMSDQFRNRFSESGGKVLGELIDLSTANPEQAIEKAIKQGAKVIALFPNSQNMILDNTKNLINANQCRYPMVGGDTLYSNGILKGVGRAAANCLVVAVPWHSKNKDSPNQEFSKATEKLWEGQVSWRTALAYDATRALIEAITQSKQNGKTVQQVLAARNFQATGATGVIRFEENGERKESNLKLVKLVAKQGNPVFEPLPTTP